MHTSKWGTKAYLESLHRTYQVPLPRRDDGAFERALQFRAEEKDFYGRLQQENDQLRHRVSKLESTLCTLERDSNTLLQFYEERKTSSKAPANGNPKPAVASTCSSRSDAGRSVAAGTAGSTGGSAGRADEVSGEVLPTELPDTGGSGTEHAGDGPEPGKGVESGGGEAESV